MTGRNWVGKQKQTGKSWNLVKHDGTIIYAEDDATIFDQILALIWQFQLNFPSLYCFVTKQL